MGSADSDIMRAFIIAALAAVVAGDAKPYTVGQVLAGATHGGVITSTTYHGGLKVAGFPHVATALVPAAVGYAAPVVYGKREAEPYTVGQVLAGHTAGGVITSTTYAGDSRCPVCHLPTSAMATQSSTARGRRSPSTSSTTTSELLPQPILFTRWPPPPSVSPTLPTWASAPTSSELLSPAKFCSLEMSWTRINWNFDQTPFVNTTQAFVK